jgi:N-acetylglucosamine-6-phosphate deacetylase
MDQTAAHPPVDSVAYRAARIWPLTSPSGGPLVDHAIVVRAGRIERLLPGANLEKSMPVRDLGDVDLVPGFIDVQVNGGGGVLFNDEPTVEGVRAIVRAHRRFGTTSLLPTFITDGLPAMKSARKAIDECLAGAEPGVLGVHFEGPFLDERKTGAHDRGHVRAPEPGDLEVIVQSAAEGVTLLTLSANRYTQEVADTLRSAGVIVSLGHCASTFEEASAAIARGATGVTHLYNAMSPLQSRAPGLVGAALASGSVHCGLILDGVHVSYGAAQAALRALGRDRMMLVTDAVQPVGTDMDEFMLGGQRVRLEGTRCINEEGNLAGSALDMASAVRNAVQHLGLGLEEAVWLATQSPARFLGLEGEIGSLQVGMRADFTLLDPSLHVSGTVVGGEQVAS